MHRRHHAITLEQATQESPMLARLTALARDSSARLQAILPLLAPGVRPHVQAGPIHPDGDEWCILVKGTAAAAKLRQLLPALESHLHASGWPTCRIRLKVQEFAPQPQPQPQSPR